jgi:hypothetical protein
MLRRSLPPGLAKGENPGAEHERVGTRHHTCCTPPLDKPLTRMDVATIRIAQDDRIRFDWTGHR